MSQVQWAEDDFDLPQGAAPLGLSEPVDGKTYIMYHGTTKKNAQSIRANGFQQSAGGMLGRGVYLSRDLKKASRYPIGHPESDRAVVKVKVEVGKVIAINRQGHPLQRSWHDKGYDTAWVPPNCGMVKSGLEEDCVWDPKRIKVINIINPTPVRGRSADESVERNRRRGISLAELLSPENSEYFDRVFGPVLFGRNNAYHPMYDAPWGPPRYGMMPNWSDENFRLSRIIPFNPFQVEPPHHCCLCHGHYC